MADPLETNRFYDFGPYRLDRQGRVLLRGQCIVPLTPKALDTLLVLVENRGVVISKDQLLKAVWPDTFVEESNLSQNISVLRKTLGQNGSPATYIETVSKRGYRFVAEVRTVEVNPQPVLPRAVEDGGAPPWAWRFSRRPILAAGTAVILCAALAGWYYNQSQSALPDIRSIAVLPLQNLTEDPGEGYFADGITELLTSEISKALPVRVTSRTSAVRLRNSGKSLPAMARELGADAVIEGSVARSGGRLRIVARLVYAPSDRLIWSENYDWELTDVLALQQEIARAVAHAIRARVSPERPGRPSPVNRQAFEDFLRARYYLDQRTAESIPKAAELFRKAIAQDPAFPRAYAGMADCYNQLGTVMIGGQSPSQSRKLAIAAASRALEMDPGLAEAHAVLGYSNLYEWNWDQARESLQRAIALNPNYAPAHLWHAHYLAAREMFEQALQEVRLARDLDPLSPIIQTQVGWVLAKPGRFPEAITEYRKALEMEPDYPWAKWQLGNALSASGDYAAAIQVLQEAVSRGRPASALASLGRAYGLAGRRKEAEAILDELLNLSRERYVPPHCFVTVYWGLRDREKVFEWLEKSYAERSNSLLWMGAWTDSEWLRSDPRYENLMRRVGLK